jgi:hypothetical protein
MFQSVSGATRWLPFSFRAIGIDLILLAKIAESSRFEIEGAAATFNKVVLLSLQDLSTLGFLAALTCGKPRRISRVKQSSRR